MSGKIVSAALLVAVFAAAPALADLRGPAELPPASYKGQQYVDSRGCVFLRAGIGGKATWVPRVSRDRKQLCSAAPSGRPVEVAEAPPVAAPAPAPVVAAAPVAVPAPPPAAKPAPLPVAKPAPVAKAAPTYRAPTYRTAAAPLAPAKVWPPATPPAVVHAPAALPAPSATALAGIQGSPTHVGGGNGYRLACPSDVPHAIRVEVRGGGSKVLCTRGDGSFSDAVFPKLVAGDLSGNRIGFDAYDAAQVRHGGGTSFGVAAASAATPAGGYVVASTADALPASGVNPPPGYKPAWDDGRLNPNRGKQTVQGVVDQDEVWTRHVPARPRVGKDAKKAPLTVVVRHGDGSTSTHSGVVVSTKNGGTAVKITGPAVSKSSRGGAEVPAAAPAAGGRFMVQVGSFGVASNAEGAAARLRGMGYPVARGKAGGGKLQVVYAGPFGSADEARAAQAQARSAGFSDAVIVR